MPHVVQMLESGMIDCDGECWRAILLQPYGRQLEHCDAPSLLARVAFDVAQAISECASRGIMHRDITAGNFMEYQQQGYLCDFNAAQEVPCRKASLLCSISWNMCLSK